MSDGLGLGKVGQTPILDEKRQCLPLVLQAVAFVCVSHSKKYSTLSYGTRPVGIYL